MKIIITLEKGYKDRPKTIKAIEKKGFTITKKYSDLNIIEGFMNLQNTNDLTFASNKILDIEGVIAVEADDNDYIEYDDEIEEDELDDC